MFRIVRSIFKVVDIGAKRLLPLIHRLLNIKAISLTFAAHYSRRFGSRAIFIAGVMATAYAAYLYASSIWTPNAPKASHDAILKSRFSSPLPASNVIVVDIDERSLASLSERHGRWPWTRDVLADGLQRIMDLGGRAVLFNVMLSDPDKANPDADAAMEVTAQMNQAVAFPLIRLNQKNDTQSQLRISQIPGSQRKPGQSEEKTIAVILPMFSAMHDRLGIANQHPDSDGIVRRYPLRWQEGGYMLPSLVQRTAELGGADLVRVPDTFSLNWRNKRGRYQRVSFSDLLTDQLTDEQKAGLTDAYVVLSVSAPGLGQTKPTSVTSIEDDGEILATALDDALNDTYLRTMPHWVTLIINLTAIWTLVWFSIKPFQSSMFNKIFVFAQSGLGGITILSASYTCYLIDLSECMSFGLSVFAAIKLIQSMDDRWSRARPGFRRSSKKSQPGQVLVISHMQGDLTEGSAKKLQKHLEEIVGLANVIRVDDLLGGESFLAGTCGKIHYLLVHMHEEHSVPLGKLLAMEAYQQVDTAQHNLIHPWDPESKACAKELAPVLLKCGAGLFVNGKELPPTAT